MNIRDINKIRATFIKIASYNPIGKEYFLELHTLEERFFTLDYDFNDLLRVVFDSNKNNNV